MFVVMLLMLYALYIRRLRYFDEPRFRRRWLMPPLCCHADAYAACLRH